MKKSLLALTTALSFGFAAAQTTAPVSATQVPALTDVPAGHWAKDAIDRLVSRGIILGYPDGTFRGTQNLTRYEAAIIIARLLDQVRSGEAPDMNQEDMTALQNAIQELAADLAALGVRVSDLEANAVSKDDFARLEARIEEVASAGNTGDEGASEALQGQIDELTARVDEYDTLRADVDDNASSVAALNDLTVLLNQDILDLQDRVSTVESAQADFVQRSDFDALGSRVGVVETRIESVNNSLTGRIANLERNAFSIKPTLSIGYSVSRANRNFDVDRLFPLNADGTVASNAFSSGGVDGDTGALGRDFGDFGGDSSVVLQDAAGLYGFASKVSPVYKEGSTSISLGLTFGNSGQFNQVTSASGGSLFSTAGKLTVNKIDVDFGLVSGLPDGAYIDANANGSKDAGEGIYDTTTNAGNKTTFAGNYGTYNIVDGSGYSYKPVFFKFKNATAEFSVGNNPVIVTIGRKMKFYFADYAFDNDYTGRGDGYKVAVDGSNLPVIGAWKPQILGVYGSRNGASYNGSKAADVGYGVYYRGLRAEITPVGTLKAGVYYAQEGVDAFGGANAQVPSDVTLYGADVHGKAFGVSLHSEYTHSTVNPYDAVGSKSDVYNANAFYVRIAERDDKKNFALNKPGASFGTDMFKFDLYDLNYRSIDKTVTATSGISETNAMTSLKEGYGSYSSTKQNLAYNRDDAGAVTAPFANLSQITPVLDANGNFTYNADGTVKTTAMAIGQKGFGVKAATAIGPVMLGGYYDSSTGADGSNAMVEAGGSAKLAYSIFSVRGDYNTLDSSKRNQAYADANGTQIVGTPKVNRYAVQADVNPGLGFFVGAYYRDVTVNGVRSTTDRGLLSRGYEISSFGPGADSKDYRVGANCADTTFGTAVKDQDGVGDVLNPGKDPYASRSTTCFTSYGVEAGHNGGADSALVKDLFFRVGYARVYNDRLATPNYDGNVVYGDARYDRKVGVANVRVAGSLSNSSLKLDSRPAGTRGAFGVIVRTDPLAALPFSPVLNGQFGYYTSTFTDANNAAAKANAMKYGAGIVLSDFLLPQTKIGVRYDGYQAYNRKYVDYVTAADTGYFMDDANNRTTKLNGVYVEGAYQDLVFSYGVYNLSQKDKAGVEYGSGLGNNQAAKGQTFKISYKVNF